MSFPNFLFLLFLLPIPIIIHLLAKRNLEEKDFPTLLFLLKSEPRLIRWVQLKRLLLLLLRVGMIVFLVLAASNLLIPFSFFEPERLVIVDHSLSMKDRVVSEKRTLAVPNRGGVPLIFKTVMKHPIGILISDAQRNGFLELLKKQKKFPGIDLKRISLPEGNLGIIKQITGPLFAGRKIEVLFTLLNEYEGNKRTPLTLEVDGKILQKKIITLKPGINKTEFALSLKEGPHWGSLEVEDRKGFDFDNIYHFSLFVLRRINVTILSQSRPERLLAALNPIYFKVKWVQKIKKIKGDIFLVSDIPEKELPRGANETIPGIIGLSVENDFPFANEIPERVSKIAGSFPSSEFLNFQSLTDIPIHYNWKLNNGETLLHFKNGDAFIKRIGDHLFLPISLEDSDLSLHPIYIPFLYELISLLLGRGYNGNILMSEPVVITSSFKPTVISPIGKRYNPELIGENRYLFTKTEEVGIYEVSDGQRARGFISVNPDPSESRLEILKEEEETFLFGKGGYSNGTSFFLVIALLCFILGVILEKR
ncbi:MAG: BatA domain-containing protein [candidate division WOR-3 bacterium]|nr:BatA domain-containing protein [candidate division WOR-3 bacterium]